MLMIPSDVFCRGKTEKQEHRFKISDPGLSKKKSSVSEFLLVCAMALCWTVKVLQ